MTMGRRIRVLVVDDSAFMRKAISGMLQSDPEISVAATANNGQEAVQKVLELSPDVVTMDVEMPGMSGIEALRTIMAVRPTPVLMLSSVTTEGARVTLDALSLGAVDFVPKNLVDMSVEIMRVKDELIGKVKAVAGKKVRQDRPVQRKCHAMSELFVRKQSGRTSLIAIGASTGGPKALEEMLPMLPGNVPVPILLVQHMPPTFLPPFAERLDKSCRLEVRIAGNGDILKPGRVFLAPGGTHMKLKRLHNIDIGISLESEPSDLLHRPSVDVMMGSAEEFFPGRCLGVILTGMGCDGKEGMRKIKKGGGRTLAQDEATSVVYGMPKAVAEEGLADKTAPIDEMAGEILNLI